MRHPMARRRKRILLLQQIFATDPNQVLKNLDPNFFVRWAESFYQIDDVEPNVANKDKKPNKTIPVKYSLFKTESILAMEADDYQKQAGLGTADYRLKSGINNRALRNKEKIELFKREKIVW